MKIAFISLMSAAPWGGSEALWSRTAIEAIAQGHTVYASVASWPVVPAAIARLQNLGCIVHKRPHYSSKLTVRLGRRVQHALGLKSLEQSLASFAPDLICLSQGGNFDIADMPALRQFLLTSGIPFCIICHNYDPSRLPSYQRRQAAIEAYKGAQKVFFGSADQANVSQRQLARMFDNIEIHKNPFNLVQSALLPWPAERRVMMAMVGGLHIDFKGQDVLLEVLGKEKWLGREWHLNIYGEGYDVEYIKDLIVMYGLGDRVTLHGHVQDISAVWSQNQVLLLPSRREDAPLVAMEAMLCGRPVVATAVGAIPEWVDHGNNGFIAAAATVSAFDLALEEAWHHRTDWQAMGQRAYHWASQNADPVAETTFLQRIIACT